MTEASIKYLIGCTALVVLAGIAALMVVKVAEALGGCS